MPIKPENRARYPKNWKEIRARIQQRAGDACEFCDVPNHALIYRDKDGDWHAVGEEGKKYLQPMISANWARAMGFKVIEVVCTTAHLDHVVENCSNNNLKFLCQRCHLAYDAKHHAQNSYQTRRKGKASSDMLT